MTNKFVFIVSTVLFFLYNLCDGLECYNCYSGATNFSERGPQFVPCNEVNLTLSNTMVCPDPKSKCIYEVLEIEYTKTKQIWRTCSDANFEPCDPKSLLPGLKMIKCTYCNSDKCNLYEGKKEDNTFTLNINANINLFIRQ